MRIISYNVNGIRAAIKRGFIEWLKTDPGDIICLQEIKASRKDIDIDLIHNIDNLILELKEDFPICEKTWGKINQIFN